MTYTGLETYVQQAAFHKTLSRLYGAEGAEKAHSRCMEVMEEFYKTFDRPAEALFSAPGRTEIGGNHTDHQKGCVLAASVDLDILAAVAPEYPDQQKRPVRSPSDDRGGFLRSPYGRVR